MNLLPVHHHIELVGTYTIDKILTPKALSYLKGKQIKKEKADVDDDDEVIIVEDEVSETKKQVVRYILKLCLKLRTWS